MQLESLIPSPLHTYFASARTPLFLKQRSSKWFIILTVSTAIFTDVFLYGIIVPVVPFALTSRANVPPNSVQHWVAILLAVYSVGLLVGSPIMGWVSDRLPTRRIVLLSGLVILSGATIMLCVGNSIGILVVGRILQGLSASVVWTTGLALLVDTVGQREVGQTMGIISLAYSVGILVGPLLGGVVYARNGYFAVFYLAFGLIAIDIVLRLAFIEKKVAARWLRAEENVASVSPGLEMGPVDHEQQTQEPLGEVAMTPSIADEATTGASARPRQLPPMLSLLSSRRLLAGFWGILVVASLTTAFDTTLPLYAHKIFGWNSLGSGLLFLALLLPSSAGPIVGRLSDRYGPRWLATVGFISALPFWVLLRLVTHKETSQIVLLCALLILIGICVALCLSPLMAEFTYIVEAKERQRPGLFGAKGAYAQAYGLFNTAWAAGSIVGPIKLTWLKWAGFVQERAGWGTMTWSLGVLSAVSAVPVVVWTGGLISRSHAQFRVHA